MPAHLQDVEAVQVGSSNHHPRQHEGEAQAHAPAPGPRLVTHRQSSLGILENMEKNFVFYDSIFGIYGFNITDIKISNTESNMSPK